MGTASVSLPPSAAAPRPPAKAPRRRSFRPRGAALRLWWELLAGPGPRWLRLLRWAQRNCRD
ncbi:hypothetical protein [Sphingomonas sanxanigenens]|uniref:hypothetical protein n=1 Tax=Sphingomonas sanxanigenens TaxID=397260 RepID=UPI0004B19912|nr:hypothetical protein [Sphingomonas sanxanigenens]